MCICSLYKLERMPENIILSRQKEANLGRISLIREGCKVEKFKFTIHFNFFVPCLLCISFPSAITMLPAMTFGFITAYVAIALPKYQQPNPTGIILDLNQISWIGK